MSAYPWACDTPDTFVSRAPHPSKFVCIIVFFNPHARGAAYVLCIALIIVGRRLLFTVQLFVHLEHVSMALFERLCDVFWMSSQKITTPTVSTIKATAAGAIAPMLTALLRAMRATIAATLCRIASTTMTVSPTTTVRYSVPVRFSYTLLFESTKKSAETVRFGKPLLLLTTLRLMFVLSHVCDLFDHVAPPIISSDVWSSLTWYI